MYVEGKARIRYTKGAFLNPRARLLRDISVAFISQQLGSNAILDATTGTGIRGIRYWKETNAASVTMLDINGQAAGTAARNVAFNRVKARVLSTSIQEFANRKEGAFDIIDVDPFGGISPYVYDIMKVSRDGTCLLLTTTDTAVLCGAHEQACIRLYGSKPMHNELCHEVGIRIMVNYIATVAAQFNFGIEVMLAVSYAHYMRAFVRLAHGSANAVSAIRNTGHAYYCGKCGFRGYSKGMFPSMSECGSCAARLQVAGKLWLGSLKDGSTTSAMLEHPEAGMMSESGISFLRTVHEEADIPLYYSIPKMTKIMHRRSVSPLRVIEGLAELGYRATRTHFDASSVKTDADVDAVRKCIEGISR